MPTTAASARRIRGVLVDLSGTLHVEDRVLPGVVTALRRLLVTEDIGVRFVTNTTKQSRVELIADLRRLGLTDIAPAHVLTTGIIARQLIETRGLRPMLLVASSLATEFDGVINDATAPPNAVVVGLAPEHFHYDQLNAAFRVLHGGGELIALHEGRYFAVKGGGLNLGPGAFVKALEFSAGTTATIIGKPSAQFFQQALLDLQVDAAEAVMIGDDVRQDVGGAQAMGMRGILVQTGKYRPGDELSVAGSPPWHVAKDFAAAVEWILAQNESSNA